MKIETIRRWLKSTGQDRAWLAAQCGVSKSTVDGWMAGRPITKPSLNLIAGLMFKNRNLAPRFTTEEYEAIARAAKKDGKTLDEWVTDAVLKALLKALLKEDLPPGMPPPESFREIDERFTKRAKL